MTVRQALAQAGLAPVDAQVLLAHVLGVGRAWLIAHATDTLSTADVASFAALAQRRRDDEPVAYLTGVREFWGLSLAVDRSVLIPRPETETLVECTLRALPLDRPVRVLDLGTGSGAIALAIAHERPQAAVLPGISIA
jgi:release factor glutamine methyltransferase